MTVTINGSSGITAPEVILDNTTADGGQVVLKSSGYSNWNLDNYSGRFRAYYNSTEYFTIDSSGNVGIGTSSPSAKLHVAGNITVNDGQQYCFGSNNYNGMAGSAASNIVQFYTNNAERARIDSSGNLLVGQTAANYGNLGMFITDSGRQIGVASDMNYPMLINRKSTTGTLFGFFYNQAQVGAITTNGTTTTYSTSSDYRLKENITPMQDALSVVQALKPCTYTWKSDGSDGQGFIAHELQAVVPDCVSGEKDAVDDDGNPVYQGIDTSFLVATLTAAIQELKAIVDEQAAKITALENK